MREHVHSSTPADRPPCRAWLGWLLPVGFVALAATFVVASRPPRIPVAPAAVIDPALLAVGPRREALTDPASIVVGGAPQTCNGCHQIFAVRPTDDRPREYHLDIHLRHGLNNRCINCHDAGDMQRLTLRDGTSVPFSDTPRLCAQCHGTVYRDWQRGTHGKTLGSWVTDSPDQHRLNCNQCHDPHSPKYDPYVPLPGPNTLRMRSGPHADAAPVRPHLESPLQRWLMQTHGAPAASPAEGGTHP